jgi:hypothetical protein
VQSGGQVTAIKQAVELLKEAGASVAFCAHPEACAGHAACFGTSGGLIKIEDILPFFPDFVTIDNFKEAICDSLERYNNQVQHTWLLFAQRTTFPLHLAMVVLWQKKTGALFWRWSAVDSAAGPLFLHHLTTHQPLT